MDNCERRYDISGIEFRYDNAAANGVNKNKSVDHAVGGSYIFKGFASGYGADGYADSTLISSVTDMETVSLEVKDTYWRTDNPERGDYAEDQLTSVYFSVPDYYINTYGDLYGIRAEWYEYKTKPIVVSSSGALNNYIPGRLGLSTAEDLSDDARSLYYNYLFDGTNIPTWWWAWNPYIIGIPGVNGGPYLDKLYWYFYSSDLVVKPSDIKNFLETDFARTEEYNTYLKDRFGNDLAFSDGGQFIRSVYWDSAVDTGRTRGYNLYDFTVDDAYLSVGGTVNIKNIWNIIFGQDGKNYGTTFTNVKMIEDVTNFIPNNDHYWDNLFISEDDYSVIQNQAYTAGQHTYLFRFAQTSYDGFPLDIYKHEFYRPLDSHWSGQAYTVQTTDFFNFDIISLTFARDGVYRVIPAVSDPIDVLPGLTPPTGIFDVGDWWQELLEILKWVLGIILLILILYAVATLVPSVLSVLFGGLGLLKPSGRRKNKIVNKIYLDGIKGKYKKRK
ncbi:MAG: hypothetical protein LBP62_02965 [Clostridiales bacterium]|nr:hypothetical protein [Clostridiales bacterium]